MVGEEGKDGRGEGGGEREGALVEGVGGVRVFKERGGRAEGEGVGFKGNYE